MHVEILKSDKGGGIGGGHHDLYEPTHNGATMPSSHPLSSANPPGLPRPPLHPMQQHNHGHSHLISQGPTMQQHMSNGSPMQRLQPSLPPHHGNHGPAPQPPQNHMVNHPPSSANSHPMSNMSSSSAAASVPQQQQQPAQTMVSNGGINGHTPNNAHQATQLYGDTETDNEKWWWVCCLEFCFCLL